MRACPDCGGKKTYEAKTCRPCRFKPKGTPIKLAECDCCAAPTITVPHLGELLELDRYELWPRQVCWTCDGRRHYVAKGGALESCPTCDGEGMVGAEVVAGMVALDAGDKARSLADGEELRPGEALHAAHCSCAASRQIEEIAA